MCIWLHILLYNWQMENDKTFWIKQKFCKANEEDDFKVIYVRRGAYRFRSPFMT